MRRTTRTRVRRTTLRWWRARWRSSGTGRRTVAWKQIKTWFENRRMTQKRPLRGSTRAPQQRRRGAGKRAPPRARGAASKKTASRKKTSNATARRSVDEPRPVEGPARVKRRTAMVLVRFGRLRRRRRRRRGRRSRRGRGVTREGRSLGRTLVGVDARHVVGRHTRRAHQRGTAMTPPFRRRNQIKDADKPTNERNANERVRRGARTLRRA